MYLLAIPRRNMQTQPFHGRHNFATLFEATETFVNIAEGSPADDERLHGLDMPSEIEVLELPEYAGV